VDHGPGFRGHFLFATATGFTNVCDKSARTAINSHNAFAYWHIAYKNGAIALPNEKGAHWGDGLCVTGTDSPIGGGTWVRPMTSLCCAWQIHHWPKGADAAPAGPSYNCNP